ncbi:TetR/AcrR family transcriptional regulator [Mycolicibacterium sp. 120270]|uniref:TetR/AcrR family transcriptional regulator n=1 Tax=Mycolicibacterium sp. 120270 TaxID=3090600 RepID=UPI00299DC0D4|nr:TetR/AcrR family transcriptional regulator [Mycolicibacterium sp. 120270]MDX1884721.1 TetR/AcrR family transcriptional regulator [Mycolicibacterium sp. 120270]
MGNPNGQVSDKLGRPRHFDDDTEREMVMDAAVRLMADQGYTRLSVAAILAEAQLSTSSFYRHFPSKEALLIAIIRRDGESARRALQRAIANASGPVAALEAWLDGLLDQFYEPAKAARTALFLTPDIFNIYQTNTELMADMRWLLCQPVIRVLRAGHRAGALYSPKPEADAVSMFALVSSVATSPHAYPRSKKSARAQAFRFIWPALRITSETTSGGARRPRSRQPR